MTLRLSITADTATPSLAQTLAMLEDKASILGAMGHRLVRDTSAHVSKWGLSHPNKLGGRRTNYWSGIAAKINPADTLQVSGNTATVTLGGPEMPGLMRAFGDIAIMPGTKTPGVKYIPLPARSEAYGIRPREIPGLIVFWGAAGPAGLATARPVIRQKNTKKGKAGEAYFVPGLVMYWFVKSVTQPQDRTLLPTEEEWSQSATDGASEWLDLELRKIKGTP